MIIFYHPRYNIDLGILSYLHPFDGKKFEKIYSTIKNISDINISIVESSINQQIIDEFSGDLLRRLLPGKRYILQALEVPYIPFIPFSVIDKRILEPMKWAVSGTIEAAKIAVSRQNSWNLSGGYHHASKSSAEGFCIYNDIGIAIEQLQKDNIILPTDKILIVDVDAHHGNGNAQVFMDNSNIDILDIYNNDIYPKSDFTKERININIPLISQMAGDEYLSKLSLGLQKIKGNYKFAFVIAGTDVIKSDPLGGLNLSISDCVNRDKLILEKLASLSIPAAFLGGGGYSKDSSIAIIQSLTELYSF